MGALDDFAKVKRENTDMFAIIITDNLPNERPIDDIEAALKGFNLVNNHQKSPIICGSKWDSLKSSVIPVETARNTIKSIISLPHVVFIQGISVRQFNFDIEIHEWKSSLENWAYGCIVEKEIILIIGDCGGLGEFLTNDIVLVCNKANIDFNDLLSLLRKLDDCSNQIVSILSKDKSTRLQLIQNPDFEEFENTFRSSLSITKGNVIIMYCGHSSKGGSLCLNDGPYFGYEFKQLLNTITIDHTKDIYFYINSCFAFDFYISALEDNIATVDMLFEKIKPLMVIMDDDPDKSLSKYNKSKEQKDQNAEFKLKQLSRLRNVTLQNMLDEDDEAKWAKEYNSKLMSSLDESSLSRAFFVKFSISRICFVPLSIGYLKGQGEFSTIFKDQEILESSLNIKLAAFVRADFEKPYKPKNVKVLDGKFKGHAPTSQSVDSPTLSVYQCSNGDSCFFQWKTFSMLIDGGFGDCKYWQDVKALKELNLVVSTHADVDHITGLLALFDWKTKNKDTGLKIEKLMTVTSEEYYNTAVETNSRGRGFIKANCLAKLCAQAEIKCIKPRTLPEIDLKNGDKIKIKCILPNQTNFNYAQDEIEKAIEAANRGLAPVNQFGIVLWLQCISNDKECNYLFTGDADGEDIIKGLSNHLHTKSLVFDYVDMPHHGSDKNNSKHFLDNIKTKRIMISTNGFKYGHPNKDTIDNLIKYKKDHPNVQIMFNQKHWKQKNVERDDYESYRDNLSAVVAENGKKTLIVSEFDSIYTSHSFQ